MMRPSKLLQFFLVFISCAANAAKVDDGVGAYSRGDYSTATRILTPLAIRGDAVAKLYMGIMAERGLGAAKDDARAAEWYRSAAEQGEPTAAFNLSALYHFGRGVPKDIYWSLLWTQRAANSGHSGAQYNLGVMYEHGQSLPKDETLAAFWYRKSAERGKASAQFNLALLLEDGRGVVRDPRQASTWYRKAADQGHPQAQNNLSFLYANGLGVGRDDLQAYFWLVLAGIGGAEEALNARARYQTRLTADQMQAVEAEAKSWRVGEVRDLKPESQARTEKQPEKTGTGFRVALGIFLTNNHVIESCASLRINGSANAKVLIRDAKSDVALVAAAGDQGVVATIRSTRPQLGEEISVAGFPLYGMLSGLSVTSGNISRLSGLNGDTRLLQISAPVQPGNSGGPLLDTSGAVLGVVVSKLDALRVAKLTGDIPQNVNFALNTNVVRSLLDASGTNYVNAIPGRRLSPADIASRAGQFTVLIECWR